MSVTDYQTFVRFIKKTDLKCAYLLITLFSAIKLRDAEGTFPMERLVDFFIQFYKLREKYKLALDKDCNPLQAENRNQTIELINKKPINTLLKNKILQTPERFNSEINKMLFENEHEILLTVKTKFVLFYLDALKDRNITLNLFPDEMGQTFLQDLIIECINEWQEFIRETIQSDMSKKLAESHEKINLEFLLKYLYQSYSAKSMNFLLGSFKMTQEEFNNNISSDFDYSKFLTSNAFVAQATDSPKTLESPQFSPEEAEFLEFARSQEQTPPSRDRIQSLTDVWKQMSETDVEEDFYETKQKALEESQLALEGKQKKKKKKKKGRFKRLFKK